ncbi:ras-related protein Rab-7b [Platysternon megacephalum]|uniref:Ras-related protein Rab-7b n=1 Tax=Platysternon megacephalum TaxID=55544 RepID=A0A4D9DIU0_9SAUR|nr:ras-related protein Rab-7b [Platysternon megacephalum]
MSSLCKQGVNVVQSRCKRGVPNALTLCKAGVIRVCGLGKQMETWCKPRVTTVQNTAREGETAHVASLLVCTLGARAKRWLAPDLVSPRAREVAGLVKGGVADGGERALEG